MAGIKNKIVNIRTVGALIEALKTYDPTLPIEVGMDNQATTYQTVPEKGEHPRDARGIVEICGNDPWGEDEENEGD